MTRLLVAIKQLLEALTQWSTGRISENEVSDVYVRLGNDFNAAVAAFSQFNIDMRFVLKLSSLSLAPLTSLNSELMSVPDDLRNILETCLAEEATPAVLDLYLPDVRKIITNLLQGLRSKQSVYRRTVSDRSRQSTSSSQGDSPRLRDSRASARSGHDRTRTAPRERESRQSGSTRRPDPMPEYQVRTIIPSEEAEWAGGPIPPTSLPSAPNERIQSSGHPPRRNQSAGSSRYPPRQDFLPPPAEEDEGFTPPAEPPTEASPPVFQAPSNLVRYSLSDRPVPASPPVVASESGGLSFVLDPASPDSGDNAFVSVDNDPQTSNEPVRPASPTFERERDIVPPMDRLRAPTMESSLAALKKSDALERRASKRFSTYTFSKMTGTRDKGLSALDKLVAGDDRRRNRRSAAFGGNLTPGDLESLAEETESPTKASKHRDASRGNRSDSSSSGSRRPIRASSPGNEPPPVPPIPEERIPNSSSQTLNEAEPTSEDVASNLALPISIDKALSEPSTPGLQTVTVFLKVGLQVKKVTLEKDGLSIPSLRLQFTEKFSYNPGMDNFPAIYINDPSSHIQYELEDMDEIKDKSLLSLNIEREYLPFIFCHVIAAHLPTG